MKLNEDGLAYGFSMIVLYFVAATAIWFCWSFVFNVILGSVINPDILAGGISVQTANAVDWNVNFIRYAPPVIILAGFIYTVNRAVFKKQGAT